MDYGWNCAREGVLYGRNRYISCSRQLKFHQFIFHGKQRLSALGFFPDPWMASILAQFLIQIKEKPAAVLDKFLSRKYIWNGSHFGSEGHRVESNSPSWTCWIVFTMLGGRSWCCTAWPSVQTPVSQWWSDGVIHGAPSRSAGTLHTRLDLWVCSSDRAFVWAEGVSYGKDNSGKSFLIYWIKINRLSL